MASRYVIYSDEFGVLLGESMAGAVFWSSFKNVGVSRAITFESQDVAQEYLDSWDVIPPSDVKFVKVKPDYGRYVSEKRCMEAGLSGWTC